MCLLNEKLIEKPVKNHTFLLFISCVCMLLPSGQQIQSRQLRERLAELEIEIERFRKENAALTKLRQENEKKQETLR